ncbi:hypothetical protein [Pseudescherichia sp.]|uniref:hypothetical protein n=1 Tax=Pseudescherichia sp. TaxID=2055881 RepID=UPI0028A20873|nr:hypothetical protein [Pseudescherichia sp.]
MKGVIECQHADDAEVLEKLKHYGFDAEITDSVTFDEVSEPLYAVTHHDGVLVLNCTLSGLINFCNSRK